MYKTLKRLIRDLLSPWRRPPYNSEWLEGMEDIYKQGKPTKNPLGFEYGMRHGKVQAGPGFLRPRGAGGDRPVTPPNERSSSMPGRTEEDEGNPDSTTD
jgi:hypothetical protein